MYLQHFGLSEAPFSITPDPAFVYLSAAHREALAHLLYGVGKGGSGGFVQLTGEVGTGKTTICRCLLEQVPDDTRLALILNPLVTPHELLQSICEELGVAIDHCGDSSKCVVDALNRYLLDEFAAGRRVVVVIDEAQNLSPDALEQIRLLTNLETSKHKLLQMVLLGQPELRQLLQRQNLRQLAQRITARYHLAPLNEAETVAYVKHRMRVAGARQEHFTPRSLRALFRCSGGVPRLINIIADRALAAAYSAESQSVTPAMIRAAAAEVQPSEEGVMRAPASAWVPALAGIALAAVSVLVWQSGWLSPENSPLPAPASLPSSQSASAPVPVTEPATAKLSVPSGTQLTPQTQSQAETMQPQSVQPGRTPATGVEEVDPGGQQLVDQHGGASAWGDEFGAVQTSLEPDWLQAQARLAWGALAELWDHPLQGENIRFACSGQHGTGFACLQASGSWSALSSLGLPVLLVLVNDDSEALVVLRGLHHDQLLLGAGASPRVFTRDAVEPFWRGEYRVAWPQSPQWPIELRRGADPAAMEIVARMARAVQPPWQGEARFDEEFENWLMDFQRRNGLLPDGIIGPQSLLYLMAPGVDKPRLLSPAPEQG